MKLETITSNKADIFPVIEFNDGFNVILAEVLRPKDKSKDSHNLGKSTLIDLLDFLLLKEGLTGHFLYENGERFSDFVFALGIVTHSGERLVIRRSVESSSRVDIKTGLKTGEAFDGINAPPANWSHPDTTIERAQEILDSRLRLDVIQGWSYRKGVSYFLRTQADYNDVFQIGKYNKGRHADWKPYLAKVLGFDAELLKKKYDLDEKVEETKRKLSSFPSEFEETDFDQLQGRILIKEVDIENRSKEIDGFNFGDEEKQINSDLIRRVEEGVASLNEERYSLAFETDKIEEALRLKVEFNVAEVKETFEESKVYFPEHLLRSYDEVVAFNKQMTSERRRNLSKRLQSLKGRLVEIENSLSLLNKERARDLGILRELDSMKKFKGIQKLLAKDEAELARLQRDLELLKEKMRLSKEIRSLEKQLINTIEEIRDNTTKKNTIYETIRVRFSAIIKQVLNVPAQIYVRPNDLGNLDFHAEISVDDESQLVSSQSKGTSYKKLLCAAFDLAILETYYKHPFFHFVYHDGVLEGLDNRKKECLLAVIKEACEKYSIQYLLTVIDTDLPRDDKDQKLAFPEGVVIRKLHDADDSGRLFRMPKF